LKVRGDAAIEVIPAIDIKDGQCVRLYQGDYDRETVFSADPLEVALKWQSAGAPRLHVVDLDGAREGEPRNLNIVKEIAGAILIPVQLGGGIRTLETVKEVLEVGIDRVVLSTAAVENARLVDEACRRYRESVVVSVDARDGNVAIRGWQKETELRAVAFIRAMIKLGVRRFIYTDISRDGTLTEPNFTAIEEVVEATKAPVVAAGGICSLSHLKMLKKLGVEGAIVGRALYTGDINLKQALAEISQT
jgi:phosphoribosylformimino-5-aminoimidazole carboxamide ribotide isomerase